MTEEFNTLLQHINSSEEMQCYEIEKGFLFESGKKVAVCIGGKIFDLLYYREAKDINHKEYEIKEVCRQKNRKRKHHSI